MTNLNPIIITTHWGQHDDDCYACKLKTLVFDRGRPKTHVKKGDPWNGNPVKERIEELVTNGRKVDEHFAEKAQKEEREKAKANG